jgi:hypothetical protein
MDAFKRALIEKAGHEHGWENVLGGEPDAVLLASARHRAHIRVTLSGKDWVIEIPSGLIRQELARSFPDAAQSAGCFCAQSTDQLACLLRRAAELAQSLPHQAAHTFARRLQEALNGHIIAGTEVERMTKQRIGQDTFREALLDYWGGACAVTSIALPELLRASHAKPWAACESDEERLDLFNGFLLCANLDVLFDKGLIAFNAAGQMLLSSKLDFDLRGALHLNDYPGLRWIAPQHGPYLSWHLRYVFLK